jgi:hypothetical protein
MASTRNKNACGDYYLEQRNYHLNREYTSSKYSSYGRAYKEALPDLGITPSRMSRDTLSHNPVDIESFLRGTGSTNLVTPYCPPTPEYKTLNNISFFDRLQVFMPAPLVIEKGQRPFPTPN